MFCSNKVALGLSKLELSFINQSLSSKSHLACMSIAKVQKESSAKVHQPPIVLNEP